MAIAVIVFSQSALAQSLNARPGLWKLEATSGFLRVPLTQCVTAKDMADPKKVAKVFGHPFNPMTNHPPSPGYPMPAEQAQQTSAYRDVTAECHSLTFE